jgi:hypothetical protein
MLKQGFLNVPAIDLMHIAVRVNAFAKAHTEAKDKANLVTLAK